jgi:hypothetical protein
VYCYLHHKLWVLFAVVKPLRAQVAIPCASWLALEEPQAVVRLVVQGFVPEA